MLRIRKAKVEDAVALGIIWKETYQTSYRGYLPDNFLDNIVIPDGNPFLQITYRRTEVFIYVKKVVKLKAFLICLG